MSRTILQITFQFKASRAEYTALITPLAEPIAATPGLVWKIWLMNEADCESGGIYLFESPETAQAYLTSQLIIDFASHPAIANVSVKMFEPLEALSRTTRGPLEVAAIV